ncbi:hypothetical protein R1flu_011898 [Riccia fluitans]|uniref:Uncharacterized protein n=1 Tax=Riccia fluitans TaxID=41844 RepID=A0ABD1Z9G5_9MARC
MRPGPKEETPGGSPPNNHGIRIEVLPQRTISTELSIETRFVNSISNLIGTPERTTNQVLMASLMLRTIYCVFTASNHWISEVFVKLCICGLRTWLTKWREICCCDFRFLEVGSTHSCLNVAPIQSHPMITDSVPCQRSDFIHMICSVTWSTAHCCMDEGSRAAELRLQLSASGIRYSPK